MEKQSQEILSEASKKIKELAKENKFTGADQPIITWFKATKRYKELQRLKRKIKKHQREVDRIKRPKPLIEIESRNTLW